MAQSHYDDYRSSAYFFIRRWREMNLISRLTENQIEEIVSYYANERNDWEIENGWMVKVGFCIGIISVPLLLIGILILYPLSKWQEKELDGIRDRALEKAKALSDSNCAS